MRTTSVLRHGAPSAGLRRPRQGVILLVVLALLDPVRAGRHFVRALRGHGP